MFAIAHNTILRDSLAGILQLSTERVFDTYRPLPFVGNLVIGIEDLRDGNLRLAIRYILSNVEKCVSLFIVKREWNEEEEELFDDLVKTEYRRAYDINQSALDRINKLVDSEWRRERVQQLNGWRTIPAINYSFMILNDNLKTQIDSLTRVNPCTISDHEDLLLSNKPPVLHWTPDPLDGEIQFIIQMNFSLAGPDESTFRDICRSFKSHGETSYEWSGGILLTTEPIRLHVQRLSDTLIEFAARICVDELEGEEATHPSRLIWPYLAISLKQSIQVLADHPFLQYSLLFVPYGNNFYESDKILARVFDTVIFCGTAYKFNKVGFRVGTTVHNVDIDQIFPDGVYPSLARLLSLNPPSPKYSRSESVAELISPPLASEAITTTPSSLSVSHNRGRRVSFGTIKLMSEASPTPDIPILHENGIKKNGKKEVDQYIDNMLQQTIDQLAVQSFL